MNNFQHATSLGGSGSVVNFGPQAYAKPKQIAVNERFWIKVQGNSAEENLLLYDQKRQFNMSLGPSEAGFDVLLQKVQAEQSYSGRKCHMQVSFDAVGNCVAYPSTATIKEW